MAFLRDDIFIWAETLVLDVLTNMEQREEIPSELWDNGWLRENPITAQHINQLMYLVTGAIKESLQGYPTTVEMVADSNLKENDIARVVSNKTDYYVLPVDEGSGLLITGTSLYANPKP
jgi:hypothetical protein